MKRQLYRQNAAKEVGLNLKKIIYAVLLPFIVLMIIYEGIDKLNKFSYIIKLLDSIQDMSVHLNQINSKMIALFRVFILLTLIISLIVIYLSSRSTTIKLHKIKPTDVKNIKVPKNRNN